MRRILVSLIFSIFIVASAPQAAPRVKILVDGQVRDIAATRDYVWVATDVGVVRYERRVLVP